MKKPFAPIQFSLNNYLSDNGSIDCSILCIAKQNEKKISRTFKATLNSCKVTLLGLCCFYQSASKLKIEYIIKMRSLRIRAREVKIPKSLWPSDIMRWYYICVNTGSGSGLLPQGIDQSINHTWFIIICARWRSPGSNFIRRVHELGAVSIRKTVLPGMAIPMLKIRRPNGRLIFNMEITIRR